MKQEDRDLLLKDLCARLPYGIMVKYHSYPNELKVYGVSDQIVYHTPYFVCGTIEIRDHKIEEIKPYLRPMSSMTEDEKSNYHNYRYWIEKGDIEHCTINMIDWLNAHHFDYRGLIDKGLALEAPKGMYNIKD